MLGLLNLNKPKGMTSRDAVNRVQRLIRPAKVGHAGTLDPLATGVLMLCVGKATKLLSYVQDRPKTYLGTFELGKTSETDDLEGDVVETNYEGKITRADLESLLPDFTGTIQQVPPKFSAVHVKGQRAYDLARKGKEFEIEPREVTIHSLKATDWSFPQFTLEIVCGSGTYIRSLGRDLGEKLGCGAVMTSLERTAIGDFRIDNAIDVEGLSLESIEHNLIPAGEAVRHLPTAHCDKEACERMMQGKTFHAELTGKIRTKDLIVVLFGETLACLAEWLEDEKRFQPRQVFLEQ